MNRRAPFFYLLVFGLALAPLMPAPARGEKAAQPSVVVSVEPFAYFVDKLAPGLFETVVMMPAGANHDTYEPTMAQLRSVSRAKLFIKVGHPSFTFETAWLDRIIDEARGAKVVNASEGLRLKAADPHVWLSPQAVLKIIRNIAAGLADVQPSARPVIEENLTKLEREVQDVDARVKEILSGKAGRQFLVYHSAWQYFADEYGIKELAIEREGKEPDAVQVAAIIREARRREIKTLLIEPQFSRSSAETIAGELNAKVRTVDHMRRDWSNNMISTAGVIAEALGK